MSYAPMISFTKKDYDDILTLIDAISSNLSLKDIQNIIVKKLPDIFNAESAIFFLRDADHSLSCDKTALVNLNWRYVKQYVEYYNRFDPFLKQKSGELVWRESDIVPHSEILRLNYYREFLEPQNIRHILLLTLKDENSVFGHIGVCRQDESSRCFSTNDLLKAQLLDKIISYFIQQYNFRKRHADVKKLFETSVSPTAKIFYGGAFSALCEKRLTYREQEVILFICQGLSNKEICDKLCVSLPTVVTHVHHIFEKLEVSSRSKLACKILQETSSFTGDIM
jgi:DNA-binding CsgD family transcriptional regulator